MPFQRGRKATSGERDRVDAARELAQLFVGALGAHDRLFDKRERRPRSQRPPSAGHA